MTIKNLNLTIRWLFSTNHEEFWTSLLSEIFISFALVIIVSFLFLVVIAYSSSFPSIYRREKEDLTLISLSILTSAAILLILEFQAMPIASFVSTPLEVVGTRGGSILTMDLELRLGRPERGEASIPNLNDLPTIVYEEYEEQIKISDNNVIEVKLEQNELASRINNLPKKELQSVIKKDSILKPLNAFSAEQQELLRELTIKHFSLKNQIIHKMKNLYPNDAWEFTQIVRETFFEGRSREYSLEYLQKMLSELNEKGK